MKSKRCEIERGDSDFDVAKRKWWAAACHSGLDAETMELAALLLSQVDRDKFEKTGHLVVEG